MATKAKIGNQMLQPRRLAHFHPAVVRLPGIKRRRADPMLATEIRRLNSGLVLLQNPDDMFFRVPSSSSQLTHLDYGRTPVFSGRVVREQVNNIPAFKDA